MQCAGRSIDQAHDGREALDKWQRDPFDVILMDVQMPVIGGIEATRTLREREKESDSNIPIIAVTARALHEERDTIMGQGFDGYIAKPYQIDTVFAEMKRCLEPA